MAKVLIDADGCPVVPITVALCKEYGVRCILLCDTAHEFHLDGVETLVVSKGVDSVDFALVNRVELGDVVVTQDYGLAAMCLARQGRAVNQDGMEYTDTNISALLDARYTAKKIRMSGGRTKGPRKRTAEQNRKFQLALRSMLEDSRDL